MMNEQSFWEDIEKSTEIQKKLKIVERKLGEVEEVELLFEESHILIEFIESGDKTSFKEVSKNLEDLEEKINIIEIDTLFSDEYDEKDCILSIQAGTGGLDAQDWSEILYRMYTRFCDKKSFKVEVLDYLGNTEAGLKHVTIRCKGEFAYGYLKSEAGVHRLVRISPYNSSGKRQTSFAAVEVYPEIEYSSEVEVSNEEIKIDTYRAGGAGGQHVNTSDSAVRITHIPTGIVVQCQNERSQLFNRETAMKMLISKLVKRKIDENRQKQKELVGETKNIAWGSQIRSYVMHPYTLVKDHRTNFESGNLQSVLDGNIDGFIEAYLKEII